MEEERAEREARQKPAGSAPVSPPSQPAGEHTLPAKEVGRVSGQMGGGTNKAQRQREREAILQQMNEDRQTYDVRHQGPVVEAPVQPKVATSTVRLQLRCATSGRAVTTTAYDASSQLRAVAEFASQEFGHAGDLPPLALTFPPRTVFESPEHLSSTLAELGLAPSATLLVKPPPIAHLAEAEAEEEAMARADTTGPADAQPPLEVEVPVSAAPPAGSSGGGGAAKCPLGHVMTSLHMEDEGWCDKCQTELSVGADAYTCAACDFFVCPSCGRA